MAQKVNTGYPAASAPAYEGNAVAPQYGAQPMIIVKQPQQISNAVPVNNAYGQTQHVVYVGANGQLAPTQQPVVLVQTVPTNVNTTTIPNVIPTTIQKQVNDDDYKEFFKLKLNEKTQPCCFSECCNLWVGTIIWLSLLVFGNVITFIAMAAMLSVYGGYAILVFNLIWALVSLCVNGYCLWGLFNCEPMAFMVQMVFLGITILENIIYMAVVANAGYIINILFCLWILWVFWKDYQWAKYFKDGGDYNPNMLQPNAIPTQSPR